MGMFGAIYHSIKGGYKFIVDDSDGASRELDKAVDSLHKTVILDPIGVSDIPDVIEDITSDD